MKTKIEVPEGFVLDGVDKTTGEAIFKSIEKSAQEELEEHLDMTMRLPKVRKLQEVNPNLIIGGSISLYIQGVRLERFKSGEVDYDITLPYYQILETKDGITVEEAEVRPSGSDYGETLLIDGIKADLRIDPSQKYEVIKYKDFEYKVVPLATIIKAKAEYALTRWGLKHKQDLYEMILKRK